MLYIIHVDIFSIVVLSLKCLEEFHLELAFIVELVQHM